MEESQCYTAVKVWNPDFFLNIKKEKKKIANIARLTERGYNFNSNNKEAFSDILIYFNGYDSEKEVKNAKGKQLKDNYDRPILHMDIRKSIYMIGNYGCGKSTIMKIFHTYLQHTPNIYRNITPNDIARAYNDKDYYNLLTENRKLDARGALKPQPISLCFNEYDRVIDMKEYGTTYMEIKKKFLFERYDLYKEYGVKTHITSNLDTEGNKKHLNDPELSDRFNEMYNYLHLPGKSFR